MWRPEGLLVSLPVIVFSFTVHPYFLGIFNQLQSANFPRMQKVTDVVRRGFRALGTGIPHTAAWSCGLRGNRQLCSTGVVMFCGSS